VFVSGVTGFNIKNILPMAREIYLERQKRFSTRTVNAVLGRVTTEQMPPRDGKRQLKILYGTQAGINPPAFVIFVNDKSLLHFSYERFLQNRLREEFAFRYSPIDLIFKNRRDGKEPAEKI
jgi:GTP-binding protein